MKEISFNFDNIQPFLQEAEIAAMQPEVDRLHQLLEDGKGPGNDFLGWLHLPSQIHESSLQEIQGAADSIRDQCDAFICIGIGGSYLGAQAAFTFSKPAFFNQLGKDRRQGPEIYFAGHNISSDYLSDLIQVVEGKEVCLNVISKSGTTTEPAIAFRFLKETLELKYGVDQAAKRIIATTDASQGALRGLADTSGYTSFVIPDDVGGRYSVLTPVGLLPMAVAGIDIQAVLQGAKEAEQAASQNSAFDKNPAYLYAAIRNLLYLQGRNIEIMASFHPVLKYLTEWWKQLTGESEGKNLRGIFPASVEYTTDLHSLGQWVQEGMRTIFETFLWVEESDQQMEVPLFKEDGDALNYLTGKTLDYVNLKAYEGTAQAHREGEVPNMTWNLPDRSPETLGQFFYLFERAVALSGYLMRVNPFDQPGVEFYKKNMFQLLNKPGYEKGKE